MADTQQEYTFNDDSNSFSAGSLQDYVYKPIDEGDYTFELTAIGEEKPVDPKYDPSGEKVARQFELTVIGGDKDGETIRPFFRISLHEKSNLYPVVKALMGGKIDPAQKIDGKSLIGRRAKAVVTHGTSETGKPKAVMSGWRPVKTSEKQEKAPF